MAGTRKSPSKMGQSPAVRAHHARISSTSSNPFAGPSTPAKVGGGGGGGGSSAKKSEGTPAKEWNFTYLPPSHEERKRNGRVEGRNLITWSRPRMAEKLLLHIQYECSRYRVDIPWDSIAHRLHPGSTGSAIHQHLNRLRSHLIAEGHLVPPICQKPGSRVHVDPHIRGYVRAHQDNPDDQLTTRAVRFDEPLEDRKFNLPDAVENFGRGGGGGGGGGSISGTPRGNGNFSGTPRSAGPPGGILAGVGPIGDNGSGGSSGGRGAGRMRATRGNGRGVVKIKREPSPDPADLDSDEEYRPGAKKVPKSVARRSARARKQVNARATYAEDEEEEEFGYAVPHQSVEYQEGQEDVADDEAEAEDYGAEADEYYLRYDSDNDGRAGGAGNGNGNGTGHGRGSVHSYVPQFDDEGEDADFESPQRAPARQANNNGYPTRNEYRLPPIANIMREADAFDGGDDHDNGHSDQPFFSDPRSPLGLSGQASDARVGGKGPPMRPDFYNFAASLHSGGGPSYHDEYSQGSSNNHGGHGGQDSQYSHAMSQQGQSQDPFLGQHSRASSNAGNRRFDFQSEADDDGVVDDREQSPSKRARRA
ncbi:hypothetical protein B0T20DRAFT_356343 [Sordaria brevicollis]|uniref:Uncharacterized protein n=1 Tax=Sordaria brevicollis TaxID=83679 RepID=A0AAE0UAL7_SORBR|nr:hypothetical protein B0T20DRAFT_356343 [Sordaria brevicollis]